MEEFQKEGADPKENLREEQELLKETPADEVRSSIIEEYGLDEDTNDELINRLVEKEIESGKRLSTAIKQKIAWRTKAEARTEQKSEEKPQLQPGGQPQVLDDKILDQKLNEKLEERELSSLEISDELKSELKTYAKAGGLTVRQAIQSDYFKFMKDKEDAQRKVEEAAIGGKRRAPSRQEFEIDKIPAPDMSTESGRKEWADYQKFLQSK